MDDQFEFNDDQSKTNGKEPIKITKQRFSNFMMDSNQGDLKFNAKSKEWESNFIKPKGYKHNLNTVKSMAFNYWDGVEFFGFDTKKVDRIGSKKDPGWCDCISTWETVAAAIVLGFLYFSFVYQNEVVKLLDGEPK